MVRIISDLKNRFLAENIVGRFIYINVGVFILFALLDVVGTLFNFSSSPALYLKMWLELPSAPEQYIVQPWSLVTYMFLHGGLTHILWNMLALYWFGKIFLSFFSTRHFVGLYLLGGIVGGLFFMLAYNLFPMFTSSGSNAYLVGASAAVLAIVAASAVRVPDYKINMLLIGEVKLSTLAVATVIISLLLVTSDNAGGSFAHLGGAFAGWAFAYMLNKGWDLTKGINAVIDFFVNLSARKFTFKRKPKMKFTSSAGSKHYADYEYNARKKEQNDDIDKILEKVKQSGYSSLSDDEKRRLFDASNSK